MHDAVIVVARAQHVHLRQWELLKVLQLVWPDVVRLDADVAVPVRARVFVPEPNGVSELVNQAAQYRGACTTCKYHLLPPCPPNLGRAPGEVRKERGKTLPLSFCT